MEKNKYAPPGAPIADPQVPASPPPRSIKIAVALLWAGLVLVLPALYLHTEQTAVEVAATLFSLLFVAVLYVYVYRGHGWARILLLVFMLYGLLSAIRVSDPFGLTSPENFANILSWAVDFVALYLLFFSKTSAAWFRRNAHDT